MRAALISPTEFLDDVQPFSNYHLALTHRIIFDSRYRDFYAKRSKAGDFIILDNSAAEKKGRSVPLKDVVLAAVLIKPSVVVLPDYLFDSDRTLDELENALRSPQLRFMLRVLPNVKLCAVVQGIDESDWLECFQILNDVRNGIDHLGIPKITGQIFGHRWVALERIRKRVKKPCHLFGVWWKDTLDDVALETKFDFVQGVDTPKPVRLAVHGMSLSEWTQVPRGQGFLEKKYNGVDLELLRRNCEGFVKVCEGK